MCSFFIERKQGKERAREIEMCDCIQWEPSSIKKKICTIENKLNPVFLTGISTR